MKKLRMYCCYVLALVLVAASYSCKQDSVDSPDNVNGKVPKNVRLSNYSSSSITVAWDHVEGATSYTAQLMGSKDSDKPIDRYIVITEDHYQFNGLAETRGYYIRVRANVNSATGDWVYIMNGQELARIMPKYGFVAENFVEPSPPPKQELYPNFPEGWEIHTALGGRKSGYATAGPATGGQSDIFPSGKWLMGDIYSISTASMDKNRIGSWALLFRGGSGFTPYLAMDFDLPNGASKFSFYYGAATQNAADSGGVPIYVKVEYSQDSGNTWTQLGDILEVTSADIQYFKEYKLDIKGPVRFKIGKNKVTEARMFVDEISVYKN